MKRDIIWFILLPVGIVMGLTMPMPMGLIQAIICGALLGFKIWIAVQKK